MLNNLLFNIMATSPPEVDVLFGNKSLNSGGLIGPVPYVDITNSYGPGPETNIGLVTTTIQLAGKILLTGIPPDNPPANTVGFLPLLQRASGLENDLRSCAIGNFKINHKGTGIYELLNTYLKDISFNKTNNQWTKSIDYTATLEAKNPISGCTDFVESRVDIWNIEPLEEQTYFNHTFNVNNVDPRRSSINSVGITGMPRYRISRTLSARGLPIPPTVTLSNGFVNGLSGCVSYGNVETINRMKFLNAKNWVTKESSGVFQNSVSGRLSLLPSGYYYNHNRTITADIYDGLYQINDTWLAMPTGVTHTESFSLECSTSENFTKTVRINGNIIGLSTGVNILNNDKTFITGANNIKLDLSQYREETANTNRYSNALSGLSGILPQLYRRACLGSHNYHDRSARLSADKMNAYVETNPIYMGQRPLSPVPISCQETHDPLKGTISYNYEFNNRYQAITGHGVITESIRITDQAPVDSVSQIDLLNNSTITRGLVSLSRTNPRKTLNIDLLVELPPQVEAMSRTNAQCPLYIGGNLYNDIIKLVNGNTPFSSRDAALWTNNARGRTSGVVYVENNQETWNPTEGRFTKNITWTYQQCEIQKIHFNH